MRHGVMPPCRHARKSVVISHLEDMEALADTLKQTSVADIVKRARSQSYVQRLTREQAHTTKDLAASWCPAPSRCPTR